MEEYALAASAALAPGGLFVTCAAASPPRRAGEALRKAGLRLLYLQPVVPRAGKEPFLCLLVGAREPGPELEHAPALVLRDERGARTGQHRAIRDWTGIGSRE